MAKWPTSVATDADLYQAVNALATTLASTITNSETTIALASTTGFPTAGAVLIDQEIIFYTGISGNDLTGCTRGDDGTVAAAHTSGVPVSHAIVAFHHNALKDEIEAIETSLNLTASRALASSASGRIEVSTVTAAELAYLSGVTSAIQAQLNGKQPAGTYIANPLTAGLAAGGYKITGLAAGTTNGDALRYEQVIGQFLALSGGTLTGALLLPNGSSGAPSLSFSSDPNSGFRHHVSTDGSFYMVSNGVERQQWTSDSVTIFSTTLGILAYFADSGLWLKGTNTNNSASAGFIGEYVESIISNANAPATGLWGDATSISLTAGDWDISIGSFWETNGATWTQVKNGISVTSGDSATGLVTGSNFALENWASTGTVPASKWIAISSYRLSLASTTTVYLKYSATYSAGTPRISGGSIRARRIR